MTSPTDWAIDILGKAEYELAQSKHLSRVTELDECWYTRSDSLDAFLFLIDFKLGQAVFCCISPLFVRFSWIDRFDSISVCFFLFDLCDFLTFATFWPLRLFDYLLFLVDGKIDWIWNKAVWYGIISYGRGNPAHTYYTQRLHSHALQSVSRQGE